MKPLIYYAHFAQDELGKLRRHFANIDRMVLQGLPMFVRQEIAEFILGKMGVADNRLGHGGFLRLNTILFFI